jgi:hypothetical protein
MVMTIAVIALALVPFAFAGGFICAVFALKTGLRWQMQARMGEKPTVVEPKTPKGAGASVIAPDLFRQIMTGEATKHGEE